MNESVMYDGWIIDHVIAAFSDGYTLYNDNVQALYITTFPFHIPSVKLLRG